MRPSTRGFVASLVRLPSNGGRGTERTMAGLCVQPPAYRLLCLGPREQCLSSALRTSDRELDHCFAHGLPESGLRTKVPIFFARSEKENQDKTSAESRGRFSRSQSSARYFLAEASVRAAPQNFAVRISAVRLIEQGRGISTALMRPKERAQCGVIDTGGRASRRQNLGKAFSLGPMQLLARRLATFEAPRSCNPKSP
jgi:hypothetical protein